MLKRLLIIMVPILIFLGIITACRNNNTPYNAVMYGDVYKNRTWLHDEFYQSNLTGGSWSELKEEYVSDKEYPLTRTIIISNRYDYSNVFKSFPVEVNFDNTIILMHCFTTTSVAPYEIKNIVLDEKLLTINYKNTTSKGNSTPNASSPLSKWVIVTIDKEDIEKVEFVFGN